MKFLGDDDPAWLEDDARAYILRKLCVDLREDEDYSTGQTLPLRVLAHIWLMDWKRNRTLEDTLYWTGNAILT